MTRNADLSSPTVAPGDSSSAESFLGQSRLQDATIPEHMVRGSAWMAGARWSIRAIGLVSTLILARLLTPADFGLIAMAMLIVGFIEVFAQTGQALALIRLRNPSREHFDAAWTVQILIGAVLALVLVLAAPLAAGYYRQPEVKAVIYLLSLRALISGFINIGIVAFRINLDFAKDFQFVVLEKLATFVMGITLALLLANYWALAITMVAGRFVAVLLSFGIHPYRPRLSLKKVREIWSFSMWMLWLNISEFLSRRGDEFVVGGISGTTTMGHYSVASDVATAPTLTLALPMSQALFPIYSKLTHDREALREAYLQALAAVAILSCSLGIGVAVIAEDMITVILGRQWVGAAPLISWLAVGGVAMALANNVHTILSVTGHARLSATLGWLRTAMLIPAFIVAGSLWDSEAVAAARAAILFMTLPMLFAALHRAVPVSVGQILARLWRPAVAAGCMALAVSLFHQADIREPVFRLLFDVALGSVVFAASLVLLWLASGRPPGSELALLRYLRQLLRSVEQR